MKKLIVMMMAVLCCLMLVFAAGCSNTEETAEDNTDKTDESADASDEISTDNTYEVTLGKYIGIEYTPVLAKEITDEDVQGYIDNILATYYSEDQEVTDRPVQEGDTVNLDYVGTIDGVKFDGGSYEGYDLVIGSGTFIDGFEDGLIGAEIGEVRDIVCTFPENYGTADLAGKEAVFNCTVNSITETVVPEFTDAFVAENITGYDNIADYIEYIKDYLAEEEKANTLIENNTGIAALAVENCEVVKYPQKSVDEMMESYFAVYEGYAESYGYATIEEYFEANGYTYDEMQEYIEDYCKSFIKNNIVYAEIAKAEGITVTEKDMEETKQEYIESWGYADEDDLTYETGLTFDEYYAENVSRYFDFTLEYELTISAAQEFVIDNAIALEKKGE